MPGRAPHRVRGATCGIAAAGRCMQEWTAFKEVPELFILVPILFNLKGNLEMNLASRLSTAVRSMQHACCAHAGD